MSVTRLRHRGCWREAAELLAPAAEHDPVAATERAAVLVERCLFTATGWDDARSATRHARTLARADAERAAALCEDGYLAYVATLLERADRADQAAELLDEAATLAPPATTTWARAQLRRGLVAANLHSRPDLARDWFEQAHDVAVATGDLLLQSHTLRHLAAAAAANGDREVAVAGYRESLRLRLELGFTVGIAPALVTLAEVSDPADARILRAQAAALVMALGGIPAWMEPDPEAVPTEPTPVVTMPADSDHASHL